VKRKLSILLFVLLLSAPPVIIGRNGPATQQPGKASRQGPGAATARLPEAKLVNRVLANGLEIIVLEDHSVPLVTIELAVKNGSYTEPLELNGLSHL